MRNIHFDIKPSDFLRNWVILIHLLALFIILILPVSKLFCALVFLSYLFSKNTKCLIKSFQHVQYNNWKLYLSNDKEKVVSLLNKSYISDFLVILRFCNHMKVILFRHQFNESDWRALQMILRN